MGEPRFDGIPGLHKHMTCLTTPGPNAYNIADSNLETKKQLKCSANFMVQSRPENIFKGGKKRENPSPGPGAYDVSGVGPWETSLNKQFSLNHQ